MNVKKEVKNTHRKEERFEAKTMAKSENTFVANLKESIHDKLIGPPNRLFSIATKRWH